MKVKIDDRVRLITGLGRSPGPGIKATTKDYRERRVTTVSKEPPAVFTLPSIHSIIVDLKGFCLELWYTLVYLLFIR